MPERLPVSAARRGDAPAWDALFRRYQLPLFSYVAELVRDRESALDIVQESFVNAARHIDKLREDGKFGSWLFGIAHQKVVQHWRKQSRRREAQEVSEAIDDEGSEPSDPGEWLIRKEQAAELLARVEALEPHHRSVILLRFIEDFPIEEIARITDTAPGTVKSRLHYACKILKQSLLEQPL